MVGPRNSRVSHALHALDKWTSKAWTAAALSMLSVATLVVAVLSGSSRAATFLAAVVGVITLLLVFVVQHTQARFQQITQRKLDELLQAARGADNSLIMLENASDTDVRRITRRHEAQRQV